MAETTKARSAMHGLINRSIQGFVSDTQGAATWAAVLRKAELPPGGYEPMLTYPEEETLHLLAMVAQVLGRPRAEIMEDLGTWLVSHQHAEPVRRLLRFGGASFVDFLHTLDDLPDRARLALSDLALPEIQLEEGRRGIYRLRCAPMVDGVGHVVMGLLRAMADDYGALVLLEHEGSDGIFEVVRINLLDQSYATGRRFELTAPVGG